MMGAVLASRYVEVVGRLPSRASNFFDPVARQPQLQSPRHAQASMGGHQVRTPSRSQSGPPGTAYLTQFSLGQRQPAGEGRVLSVALSVPEAPDQTHRTAGTTGPPQPNLPPPVRPLPLLFSFLSQGTISLSSGPVSTSRTS